MSAKLEKIAQQLGLYSQQISLSVVMLQLMIIQLEGQEVDREVWSMYFSAMNGGEDQMQEFRMYVYEKYFKTM